MDEALRNPQIINGEMYPRHHYFGLESVRKLHELVGYLKDFGIDLMAIPVINEIEAGLLAADFEKGDILGVVAPIPPMGIEMTQVLVWDGSWVAAVSIPMYLHKSNNGWKLPGEDGYEKLGGNHVAENAATMPEIQPSHPKKKRTIPKHEKRRKQARDRVRKNRNL